MKFSESHVHLTWDYYAILDLRNNISINEYESFKNSNFYPVLLSGNKRIVKTQF